jgi:chromosome segregation ATPase
MMRALSLAVVGALAASACGTSSKEKAFQPVAQEDVGRLSPQQMATIDAARQDLDRANDDLGRTKLRLAETSRDRGHTDAEVTTAKAELQHAEALMKDAEASREPEKLAAARQAGQTAQLQQRAAEAHQDYITKIIAAREAEVRASEARVKEMEARLEQAKLSSLQQAGIAAATKYDAERFQQSVADATGASQKAQTELAKAMGAAQKSENEWRALSEQLRVPQQQGTASGGK